MGLQMNDDEDDLKIEKEIQIINQMKNLIISVYWIYKRDLQIFCV